ncbi:MAG: MFS transporter [Tissierellia bacterium]|nr:MFS transporter [Tissierellia bacterium]
MNKKFNYGYVVALICFLIAFFYIGHANNTGSLYVVPVTSRYGFSRAEFSIIFSIISIITIIANLAFVKLYRHIGIKRVVVLGAFCCASAFFVYYKSTVLLHFYLGAFLFGIGHTYTNMIVFSLLINSWFTENRGTILGLISAGSGFGGSVMSPVVGYIISFYGFKQSYLLTSAILFILIIPIALFVKENPVESFENSNEETLVIKRKTTGQLLKEHRVILGLTVIFMMAFLIAPWLNVLPSHLMDRGFDEIFASKILGGVLFVMALAKIFVGAVYDRIGIKAAIGICLISFVISSVLLLIVKSKIIAWMFAVLFGTSLSALSVLLPLFTSALAGEEYLSDIIGIASALVGAGIALGTPVINFTYDLTGSNNIILIIFTILGILNMLLTYITLRKKQSQPVDIF